MTLATAVRWVCLSCRKARTSDVGLQPTLMDGIRLATCEYEGTRQAFRATVDAGPFDLAAGERLKEQGQARVEAGAYNQLSGWNVRFDACLRRWAATGRPFTSETITAEVGLPPSGSPSAVGARMTAAAKRGEIRKTGRMVKAQRPNQHAAMLTEWIGM